jgi:hypothetical protein
MALQLDIFWLTGVMTHLHLKRWCDITTRYTKTPASFVAAIPIHYIVLWASVPS